jgi:large subunit ribosomal protein L4e
MKKAQILSIEGKKKGTIELPKCFSFSIRKDIVSKILEAKKKKQPYAPSLIAGKQASASGKWVHRRHVWKSQYGRAWSRIPRKIMLRRGSQFNPEGATIPGTKGGRRAHPPKIESMINTKKINKKEMEMAFNSALSATADKNKILERYERLKKENIDKEFPLIVEAKLVSLKTKNLISALKKILGEKLFDIAIKKKKIRSGKGKIRGRKYKKNYGMLLVLGDNEKLKVNAFDIANVKSLNINNLSEGGLGRLTIYTEQAIKDLEKKKLKK